jgi:hypothetical protein
VSVSRWVERGRYRGRSDRRGLIPERREKRRGSGTIGQIAQRAQRLFGSAGETSDHVIGIDPNAFELGDELANYVRVRHPAPDWVWRRHTSLQREQRR